VRAKARVPSRTAGATHPATGEPAGRLRVLYADTDAGGVVYHGSYLRFFEAGRTEAMRSAGVPRARFAQHKLHLPPDWTSYRDRWDAAHTVGAALSAIAFFDTARCSVGGFVSRGRGERVRRRFVTPTGWAR
jgi:hypothetical protein